MAINRPEEWDDLGKPSIFAGLFSDKRVRFNAFLESDSPENARDMQMASLWERSKQLKKTLKLTTWSAFTMYLLSIFVVNYLLGKFS